MVAIVIIWGWISPVAHPAHNRKVSRSNRLTATTTFRAAGLEVTGDTGYDHTITTRD